MALIIQTYCSSKGSWKSGRGSGSHFCTKMPPPFCAVFLRNSDSTTLSCPPPCMPMPPPCAHGSRRSLLSTRQNRRPHRMHAGRQRAVHSNAQQPKFKGLLGTAQRSVWVHIRRLFIECTWEPLLLRKTVRLTRRSDCPMALIAPAWNPACTDMSQLKHTT